MMNVAWGKGLPSGASPSPRPDAFGIVILPAGSPAPRDLPAPRLPLRGLPAQMGNREQGTGNGPRLRGHARTRDPMPARTRP